MRLFKIIIHVLICKFVVVTEPMELQEIEIVDDERNQNKIGSVESVTVFTNICNCCVLFRKNYSINTNQCFF